MQKTQKLPAYPVLINPISVNGSSSIVSDQNSSSPSPGDGPPAGSPAAQTLAPDNRGKVGDKPPYKKKKILTESPPGMEGWMLRRKNDFVRRYGKRADDVLYGTAWNIHQIKHYLDLDESTGKFDDVASEFIAFASSYLNLDTVPPIEFKTTEPGSTFATWSPDGISVSITERHPMDVFRSLAHELVHQKQHETNVLHAESGETGSDHENEANAMAGIIMRDFGKANPSMFALKSIAEGFFGKTTRKRPSSGGFDRVLAKAVDAKIKEKGKAADHQRKIELLAAKAKSKVSTKAEPAKAAPANNEKQITHHLTQMDKMLTARDKAVDGATTRLSIDGRSHDVPNKEFYDKVAGWHQRKLKSDYGVDVEVKNKPNVDNKPKRTAKKPPPALAEAVSMRESMSLMRKAHMHKIEYKNLFEVYMRGLNDWDYSQPLTREQFAFNRVNSFVAGGKAAYLDEDLKKETL